MADYVLEGPHDVVVAKVTIQRGGKPLAHYRARWDATMAAYSIEACAIDHPFKTFYIGSGEERLRALAQMFGAAADAAAEYGYDAPRADQEVEPDD